MTDQCNLRRNPFTAAYAWRTMDTESHTVAEFDELPGVYGIQLQDRPKEETVVVTEDVTGGSAFVEVTTSPLAGQCRIDYTSGYIFFNVADDATDVTVDYDGGGSNASKQNLEDLVSNESRFTEIENDIVDIESDIVGIDEIVYGDDTGAPDLTLPQIIDELIRTWVTGTLYPVGQIRFYGYTIYMCKISHTSNVFATDYVTNGKWIALTPPPGSYMDSSVKINYDSVVWGEGIGTAISRTTYDVLNAMKAIDGYPDGAGDGATTFNLPDARGAFLRATGSHGSETMADGNAFAGPAVGSFENDKFQMWQLGASSDKTGSINYWVRTNVRDAAPVPTALPGFTPLYSRIDAQGDSGMYKAMDDGTHGTPRTGDETNPFNLGVRRYIKIL